MSMTTLPASDALNNQLRKAGRILHFTTVNAMINKGMMMAMRAFQRGDEDYSRGESYSFCVITLTPPASNIIIRLFLRNSQNSHLVVLVLAFIVRIFLYVVSIINRRLFD